MPQFSVIFDQKVTTWTRNHVYVDAESQKDAVDLVAEEAKKDRYLRSLCYTDSESLFDCEEPMTIEANEGAPTIEIMDPDDNTSVIWDNVDYYKR